MTATAPDSAQRLLLGVLRTDLTGFTGLSTTEWNAVLALADRHWVTPLLYRKLKARAHDLALSKAVWTHLRKQYLWSMFRHIRLAGKISPVLSAFRASGIDVIALKGAHLAALVYDQPALRPLIDIDLLVREQNLNDGIQILTSLGFSQKIAGKSNGAEDNTIHDDGHHVAPFRQPDGPPIELHYAVQASGGKIRTSDIDGLWKRAEPGRVYGASALILSPEDLILHLCVHAAFSHAFDIKLLRLYDIPFTIDCYQDRIDWDTLWRRACAWGVETERSVLLTFALVEHLLGWRIPEGALCGRIPLATDCAAVATAERLIFAGRSELELGQHVSRLWAEATLTGKITIFLQRVFPSPRAIRARTYLPPSPLWLPLAYLMHFGQLLSRHTPFLWRVLCKEPTMAAALALEAERASLRNWLRSA